MKTLFENLAEALSATEADDVLVEPAIFESEATVNAVSEIPPYPFPEPAPKAPRRRLHIGRLVDYLTRLNSERQDDPFDPRAPYLGRRTLYEMVTSETKTHLKDARQMGNAVLRAFLK